MCVLCHVERDIQRTIWSPALHEIEAVVQCCNRTIRSDECTAADDDEAHICHSPTRGEDLVSLAKVYDIKFAGTSGERRV